MTKSKCAVCFVAGGAAVAIGSVLVHLLDRDTVNYSLEQRCLAMYRVQRLVENKPGTPALQGDPAQGLIQARSACEGRVEKMALLGSGISMGFLMAIECANGKRVVLRYWDRGQEYGELMVTMANEPSAVLEPFAQSCRPNSREQ